MERTKVIQNTKRYNHEMASSRRSKVTIVREYDTNNIDIKPKPAPKRQDTGEEVTIESVDEVTPELHHNGIKSPTTATELTKTETDNNIDIQISSPKSNDTQEGYEIVKANQKPMKIKIQRQFNDPNSRVIALREQHGGFNGVQDDMEREMEKRKLDWEKEVGKNSQSYTFFVYLCFKCLLIVHTLILCNSIYKCFKNNSVIAVHAICNYLINNTSFL